MSPSDSKLAVTGDNDGHVCLDFMMDIFLEVAAEPENRKKRYGRRPVCTVRGKWIRSPTAGPWTGLIAAAISLSTIIVDFERLRRINF